MPSTIDPRLDEFDPRFCRVCGYDPGDPPWGDNGLDPSFEICSCCGVEWGYQDMKLEGVLKYRERWLGAGARWAYPKDDDGLSTEVRLARVIPESS